eukprot:6213483-Pleurochrysis_carterae.AAC.2
MLLTARFSWRSRLSLPSSVWLGGVNRFAEFAVRRAFDPARLSRRRREHYEARHTPHGNTDTAGQDPFGPDVLPSNPSDDRQGANGTPLAAQAPHVCGVEFHGGNHVSPIYLPKGLLETTYRFCE